MLGGVALDAAVPFGRVYSFPSVIKPLNLAKYSEFGDYVFIRLAYPNAATAQYWNYHSYVQVTI